MKKQNIFLIISILLISLISFGCSGAGSGSTGGTSTLYLVTGSFSGNNTSCTVNVRMYTNPSNKAGSTIASSTVAPSIFQQLFLSTSSSGVYHIEASQTCPGISRIGYISAANSTDDSRTVTINGASVSGITVNLY